jgi:CubicO group peptidase (beta-lactamase class C family)
MLRRSIKYQPGTHFRYDGIGSDLLSVVLSKAIERDSETFARQRLFGPLQVEHYEWKADTDGYLHGESGLWLTARDMAKIGLLYLRRGQWQGKQIVSHAFVRDSTSKHNDGGPPTHAAYGYQW